MGPIPIGGTSPPRPERRGRRLLGQGPAQAAVVAAGLIMAVVALAVTLMLQRAEEDAREMRLLDRTAVTLRHHVDHSTSALLGIRSLTDADGRMDLERFEHYAAGQLGRVDLYAMGWAPLVSAAERAAFEREHGITITEASGTSLTDLSLRPARARGTYLPYLAIARRPGPGPALPAGLDANQDARLTRAISAARDSGEPIITEAIPVGPISILQLLVPVYAPERPVDTTVQRRAAFRGVAAGAFLLGDLRAQVSTVLPSDVTLAIAPAAVTAGDGETAGVDGPQRIVRAGGIEWTLAVSAPPRGTHWIAPVTIAIGGGSLVILTALMFRQANRRQRDLATATAKQAALRRVATAAAADPDGVFSLVAREAAGLMGAEGAVVVRFDPDRIVPVGDFGLEAAGDGAIHRPIPREGSGVFAQIARDGSPARVDDYTALGPDAARALGFWADVLGSAVGVPVWVDQQLWGGLLVAHPEPRPFPPATEEDLALFADITATAISSAQARAALARQATTDPLTGLANRRAFDRRMERELARARRTGASLAAVVIDVDHFKAVNDTHGHAVGDLVLKELAQRLMAIARQQDLVARVGGEEFAWLITDADDRQAAEAAERARRAVADVPFHDVGTVTASFGVCDTRSAGATGLMRGADMALYRAKQGGRNRVELHRSDAEVETPSG